MTTTHNPTSVATANAEINKYLGGGIPLGSLALIEGESGTGKSVLCHHLAHGALLSDLAVAYYTTEYTAESLLAQMASCGLEVSDFFLVGRFRVYPLHIPSKETRSDAILARFSSHIDTLPEAFKITMVDSLTNIVASCGQASVANFLSACRAQCDEGMTIFLVVHSHALDEELLVNLRSFCDAHFTLRREQDGHRTVHVLEARKVRNSELGTGRVVTFEVQSRTGIKINSTFK